MRNNMPRTPEKTEEYRLKYNTPLHKKKRAEATARYRLRNPVKWKESRLKKEYNLTIGEYQVLSEVQNHVCAICFMPDTRSNQLVVDHNHVTGEVRGLLCHNCNLGLGNIRESVEIAYSMVDYIIKYEKNGKNN